MEELLMKSMIRILMTTLMALVSISGVWAQASAPAMPEAIINLSRFNGVWQASMNSAMDNKTYQYDYTVKCTPVAGGHGAYWEESGVHPDLGEMLTSDLLAINPADKKLHCYSIDNMGMTRDQVCIWKSPDHLYMEFNCMQDGKKVVEKADLKFTGNDLLTYTGVSTKDGKTQWSGSGTFHKITDK
jgi:hypothetical protein